MINWLLNIFSPAPKFRCDACGKVMRWAADIDVKTPGRVSYFCDEHIGEAGKFIRDVREALEKAYD